MTDSYDNRKRIMLHVDMAHFFPRWKIVNIQRFDANQLLSVQIQRKVLAEELSRPAISWQEDSGVRSGMPISTAWRLRFFSKRIWQ